MVSEEYFNRIFGALPAPSIVLLPDAPKFTIAAVNDGYLAATNSTKEYLLGKGFYEIFPENPYHKDIDWRKALSRVLKTKAPYSTPTHKYDVPVPGTKDTVVRYLNALITPVLDDKGDILCLLRTITDVTDIITVEQKEKTTTVSLSKNEKFLSETQRIAQIGSWEMNLINNEITWSDLLKEILEVDADYKPDVETALAFYKTDAARKTVSQTVEDAITHGNIIDLEQQMITAKGNERWVRITGKAEIIAGTCTRIYGAAQDITEKKNIQQALMESRNQFKSLVQSVEGIVWEADAATFEFTFVSDTVKSILGYTPEEWLSDPTFWTDHIHADDRDHAVHYCHIKTKELKNHSFDYRMIKADGDIIWVKDVVSVISENGTPKWLRGLMVDITETKRLTDLDHLEKVVLELSAQKDVELEHVLEVYLKGIEALYPIMRCSILRVKNDRLLNWSSPSLPPEYIDAIQNISIGANVGSCGTAAFFKEQVIVADIDNDPLWADYKDCALKQNLRACWSHPIVDSDSKVIAVLGMYYNEPRVPSDDELLIIDRCAALLKIILENRQNAEIIHETTLLMKQGQELANFGNWQWDIENNIVSWSDALYDIYGLNRHTFKATFEAYQDLLHPEDKERVYALIQDVLKNRKDVVFEERIIRPNGEVRTLRSWGRLVLNDKGVPVKMIGACLDITDSKISEDKLAALHNELEEHLKVLEESEKRYSDLFHMSPEPMWVYDLETLKFLDVNIAAINHYGYSREEFLDMTVMDIRPPEDIPRTLESIERSKQISEQYYFGVFRHKKKNGEIIQVDIHSNRITFNGKPTNLVLANDITERQNHIEAIEKQNKVLQEIAWIQSHVVRAPLARMMGLIGLGDSNTVDKDELFTHIMQTAHELDGIIQDITTKAKGTDIQ